VIPSFQFPNMVINEFICFRREIGSCSENSLGGRLVQLHRIEFPHDGNADLVLWVPAFAFYKESGSGTGAAHSSDIKSTISSSLREFNLITETVPNLSDKLLELPWIQC